MSEATGTEDFNLRFGLNGQDPHTLEEVGKRMGVTEKESTNRGKSIEEAETSKQKQIFERVYCGIEG